MSESFVDLLAGYGARYTPELAWTDDQDPIAWSQRFRAALQTLRSRLPERVELVPEILDETDAGSHLRRRVRLPVSDVDALVGYLLLPKTAGRHAAVIASPGHVTLGMETTAGVRFAADSDQGRQYGLFAVEAGYVVFIPAWWGWAGRDGHVERVGGRDKCNVIQMAASMYGLNVIDLHIQEAAAAVDYLVSLPEVDPARVGCLGNSYGGRTAMWMAIFDDRLRATIASGCMNTFRERSLKLSSCGIQYPHGLLRYGDVPELFALLAPRALQLQAGDADGLLNQPDRDAIAAVAQSVYRRRGAEAALELAYHGGGHYLDWSLAEPFLARHLAA